MGKCVKVNFSNCMDLHLFLTNRTGNEMLAQRENEKDRERGKEKEKT